MQDVKVVLAHFGMDRTRRIPLILGNRYLVEPLNPQKKRHRGRFCILESLDDDFMPSAARVRFEDNNRLGKAAVSDLRPCFEFSFDAET